MDAQLRPEASEGKRYTTPRWVQAWFLRRSRDKWKDKCRQLKVESKRLANRVNDVSKSREHWREQVQALREENAALREQAALKKYRPVTERSAGKPDR
jgi:predicted nuclease with TOPRIM domain